MMELLKKSAFVSLGLAVLSADNVKKIGKQIAKESKLSEAEGKKLVDDLLHQSEKSKDQLKKRIETIVRDLDLADAKDIEALGKRLESIEKKLTNSVSKTSGKAKA